MKKIMIIFGLIFVFAKILYSGYTNQTIKISEAHSYPNPFKNKEEVTHIKFKTESEVTNRNANISVVIYDFNGHKVWSKKIENQQISPEQEFEISWGGENDLGKKVAKGLYFCKIIFEANNTVYKVIKILVK